MENEPHLKQRYNTVVIGGGQAGLSASAVLADNAIDHVVLERHRVAESWRSQRWDNFCLVTPNWQCTLPGFAYDQEFGGPDPDGFMKRDEVVAYIEAFRDARSTPVIEGVAVISVSPNEEGFVVHTEQHGSTIVENVIVATGGYHKPKIPPAAQSIPGSIRQLHSSEYKNAAQVPDGGVLVVGTGQSGCQIAEDLHLEGKPVFLAVGRAPRSPRYYRGRDVTAWLVDMGAYAITVDEHPMGKQVRKKTNHYLTGRDGGREIDLRRFATEGMELRGRLADIDAGGFQFAGDLTDNLDNADASANRIRDEIDKYIAKNEIDCPPGDRYQPAWAPEETPSELAFSDVSAVIWCTGFDKDYSWIDVDAFDEDGEPEYDRGVSTYPGLYFLGLPWMHTWGSGRFSGVADDARHVIEHLMARSNAESLRGEAETWSHAASAT